MIEHQLPSTGSATPLNLCHTAHTIKHYPIQLGPVLPPWSPPDEYGEHEDAMYPMGSGDPGAYEDEPGAYDEEEMLRGYAM